MTFGAGVALLAWATAAGLDLVSVLQGLLSRPLVVGAGAGWLVGDLENGLRIGAILELFALDVVPVGSSRYPDFGAATAGAVVYGAGGRWSEVLGAAAGLGVLLAMIGGTTLPATRRLNARTVRAYGQRLAGGDPAAIRAVHLAGLAHDGVRSTVVAILAIGVGWAAGWLGLRPGPALGRLLTLVSLGGAAWAVAHGATASARSGPRWRWAVAGLALGALGVARW